MQKNKIDKEIAEHFEDRKMISREELYDYYKKYDTDLKPQTFAWRLYDLKRKNVLQEIKKGFYRISDRKPYKPVIDEQTEKIYNRIVKEFFNQRFVIWSTSWINEFTLHQAFQNFYILEAPYDVTEHVFYKMKELEIPDVFLHPDKEQMAKYIIDKDSPVVVNNLLLKAPVQKINKIYVPTLEKILVDLYTDKNTFYMYQGNELKEIFRNALKKYLLNYTKLFHYARRRGKEKELKDYMESNFKNEMGNLPDD